MSEFRRMITYLYLYERGVKSRNIGFAKIEKRDQRCLVEIHMKNTGCSLSPVPVYFYVQRKEHLIGISLGNCSLSRGIGEFKTVLQADNLQDSGYSLDTVKGIYIPLTERIMLVSQWDDDEFHQEAFVPFKEMAALAESDSDTSNSPVKQPLPEHTAAPLPEANSQPDADSSAPAAIQPPANHPNNSVSQRPGMSISNSPANPDALLSQKAVGNHSHNRNLPPSGQPTGHHRNQSVFSSSKTQANKQPQSLTSQPAEAPMDSVQNTTSQPATKPMHSVQNTAPQPAAAPMSHVQNTTSQPVEKPLDNTQNTASQSSAALPTKPTEHKNLSPMLDTQNKEEHHLSPSPKTESSPPLEQPKTDNRLNAAETIPQKTMDVLKALEALPRPVQKMTNFRAINGNAQTNKNTSTVHNTQPSEKSQAGSQTQPSHEKQTEPVEDWSLRWRFILENFPVMTPFSGDENTLCVRMELKDLRQLPRQFWYLGNNSFLLHGFFNYRYLILGMTETLGMKRWFIGVPGVFQNPERVMAALFGFPEFRSEKTSPINTGEFGYWYRYLNELTQLPGQNNS